MVPTERSYHREYSSSSTHSSKLKGQRGGQNNRIIEWQTGQKQYAPRSSTESALKVITEWSLKYACHSGHFSLLKVTESRISLEFSEDVLFFPPYPDFCVNLYIIQ